MKKYNDTTYAILGVLTTDCKSGYEVKQLIDRSLHHFWKISYGQIYPALKLIVEEGLAKVSPASTIGRSDKREYHLTEKGLDTLRQWLAQPLDQVPSERNEVLLKLFFGQYLSFEKKLVLLQDYERQLRIRYETYVAIEQNIQELYPDEADAKYWLYTLDYGKKVAQAGIDWCVETCESMKKEG